MGVLFLIILMIVGFVGSIIMWGRYQGKKLDAFMERQGIRNWRLDYGMGKTIISDYSIMHLLMTYSGQCMNLCNLISLTIYLQLHQSLELRVFQNPSGADLRNMVEESSNKALIGERSY